MKDNFEIGDRVIVFEYWNTTPNFEGFVTALSEHFVEVQKIGWREEKKWMTRERIEKVTAKRIV